MQSGPGAATPCFTIHAALSLRRIVIQLQGPPARAGTPCTEGLGPRLVEAAEAHCRAAGRRHLELDIVDLRTELPPFCAKLGFSPCGPAACGTAPCGTAPCGTAPCSDPQKSKRPASMILMTEPLAG